jgi:gliding motility-associated transport system permease protein
MRNIWILASREFRQYFISPIAYALATMLYLILGGVFFINVYFGLEGGQISPDGRIVIGVMVTILLFATPGITMRLLSDEYRMGTMELLLTAPIRDWELVVGKWLGAFGFMLAVLALTWIYPLILHRMTSPGIDQGALVAAYVGLVLMVGAMLAVGVFISALFRSPVAAFFVSLGAMLALWIVGSLGSSGGILGPLAGNLSLSEHYYNNFYYGVLDLGDAAYFLSLTALALFLGTQVIEARRWR